MLGRGHDPESDSCRFPIGRCICSSVGYTRLSEGDEGSMDAPMGEEDLDNPQASTSGVDLVEELLFYNDNQSFQSVIVEKNLCASDLCQLLAMKNRVTKSKHWCIFECWNDLGLERLLEDHEYILAAFRDMKHFSPHSNLQYKFRKDFRKFEFFHHPDQFFPQNMVNVEEGKSNKSELQHPRVPSAQVQHLVQNEYECPVLYSHIWVRDERKRTWSKSFLVLRGHKLFITPKLSMVTKFMRAPTEQQAFDLISVPPIPNHVRLFGEYICEYADLRAYHAYTALNAKNQLRAPTVWGIVLRPATIPTTTAATKSESPPAPAKTTEPPSSGSVESDDVSTASSTDLRCLACESDKVRSCWITAMRLAKYGKQLRENYRAFRNKQGDVSKDYSSYSVPNESVRSRVAMDFTGPVGRIVEDPQEAHAIATAEGCAWQRRWRGGVRPATASAMPAPDGVHCARPWFHRGMSRERATEVVNRHGTVNGVFLVRDSRSHPGSFVITYKFNGKVLHAQVNPIMDPLKERTVLSLDSGTTKFYDLLQLVEFYQLNAGCLPTRLTHYVSFALTEDEDASMIQMRTAERSN